MGNYFIGWAYLLLGDISPPPPVNILFNAMPYKEFISYIKRMCPEENTQATASESDVGEENILTK